jgi:hypothetical protein
LFHSITCAGFFLKRIDYVGLATRRLPCTLLLFSGFDLKVHQLRCESEMGNGSKGENTTVPVSSMPDLCRDVPRSCRNDLKDSAAVFQKRLNPSHKANDRPLHFMPRCAAIMPRW